MNTGAAHSTPREDRIVYRAWANGWCLCCQGDLVGDDEWPIKTIGEGVQLCGWCVERGHDQNDIVSELLRALLRGRSQHATHLEYGKEWPI